MLFIITLHWGTQFYLMIAGSAQRTQRAVHGAFHHLSPSQQTIKIHINRETIAAI